MESKNAASISFFGRLSLAFRVLFDSELARTVAASDPTRSAASNRTAPQPKAAPPAEKVHASALALLATLQREGRLIDFLKQDIAAFSDEEVGAASRVVHTGCSRVLQQYFDLAPAVKESEGATMTIPAGFDSQNIRLTGNVAGQPPFRGTLRHHGWVTREVRLPAVSDALDPRTLAPAEVELP
jgi:hypothetical protein